jgi:hypothetical protein
MRHADEAASAANGRHKLNTFFVLVAVAALGLLVANLFGVLLI